MSENIVAAMVTAMEICWDESHGYHIGADMNPDTDCSGLIGYALSHNGFNVPRRWSTTTMFPILRAYEGFTEYLWSPDFQWRNGDIAVWDNGGGENGHTFFYCSASYGYTATGDISEGGSGTYASAEKGFISPARIEASSTRGRPQEGDQPNPNGCHSEVWVHRFDPINGISNDVSKGRIWHVFRWKADDPAPPIPPVPPIPGRGYPYWLLKKLKEQSFGAII